MTVNWDVDPVLVNIPLPVVGDLPIRYYSLSWLAAILIGWWYFIRFVKREGLPPKVSDSIFFYGFFSTIIGARLGHCFFYERAYYLAHPLEIFGIGSGGLSGLASHGAAIGLLIGLWLFSRKNRLPYIWSLDRIMLCVGIGGACVRIGNLMNSEIFGTATDLPWGFLFIRSREWQQLYAPLACHPTQIYEALCYLATYFVLLWLYYKRDAARRRPGLMFGVGLLGVFFTRFLIESIKNVQEAFELEMTLNMGQRLSIPFIVLGIVIVVWSLRKKPCVQ